MFFSVYNKTPKKLSTEAPIPFAAQRRPNLSLLYLCAKNPCDVDSVTFSCVTAAPVRTPHLPCLSLFLVYRNHFNELVFVQTRQHFCRLKAAPQPGPEPSGMTPDFPFAVAKVLQKTNTNQIFQQLFFNFFPEKSPKHHKSATYPTNFFMLYNIFFLYCHPISTL